MPLSAWRCMIVLETMTTGESVSRKTDLTTIKNNINWQVVRFSCDARDGTDKSFYVRFTFLSCRSLTTVAHLVKIQMGVWDFTSVLKASLPSSTHTSPPVWSATFLSNTAKTWWELFWCTTTFLQCICDVQNVLWHLQPLYNASVIWNELHFFRNTRETFTPSDKNNVSPVTPGQCSCHVVQITLLIT